MSKVKPALSPEQWALLDRADEVHDEMIVFSDFSDRVIWYPDSRQRAAINLRGDDHGFTWEDVDELHLVCHVLDDLDWHGDADKCQHIADRIAALLPPRETP